jgi:hypothetical protein
MRIDKRLNLIIPVETENGRFYVHSTPLSRDVFERYFLVISKTFAAIHAEGLGSFGGPRVAYLMLKKIAIDSGCWEGLGGVENGLLSEIKRLSTVIAPTESGYRQMPIESAINGELFNDDDVDDIMGYAVFFICVSAMHKRELVAGTMAIVNSLWSTETSLLSCMEYLNLLPTSIAIDNSGETVTRSSIPS